MNEPTDTPVDTTYAAVVGIKAALGSDDRLVYADWGPGVDNSPFPWLYILKSAAGTLLCSTNIYVFGVSTTDNVEDVELPTIDELGIKATEASASLNTASTMTPVVDAALAKLPDSARWLYVDKPYMPAAYYSAIRNELAEAIRTGDASAELTRYIRSHAVRSEINNATAGYRSYGDYIGPANLVDVRHTSTRLRIGVWRTDNTRRIEYHLHGDVLHIEAESSTRLHIVSELRIGTAASVCTIDLSASAPVHYLRVGYTNDVSNYAETEVDTGMGWTASIDRLFSLRDRVPIWCAQSAVSATQYIPISTLTTNDGPINWPVVYALRTASGPLASGTTHDLSNESALLFGDSSISTGAMNGTIFIEYHIEHLTA